MSELPVAVATTNLRPIPREEVGCSLISKTTIQNDSGGESVVAYVKLLEIDNLIAEIVCAIIGRRMELPIPQPFLVIVPNVLVPDEHKNNLTDHVIAFGSQDAEFPSLARRLNRDSGSEINHQLLGFRKTKDVAAFDEWVANWDRNHDNILYGGDPLFQFIDHGEALERGLNPDSPAMENRLLGLYYDTLPESDRVKLSKELTSGVIASMPKLTISDLPNLEEIGKFCDADAVLTRVQFLTDRIFYIVSLIENRLRVPQTRMV